MTVDRLFVIKQFGTYADTFLMLGLALVAEDALSRTKQKTQMQLIDEGRRYCIQFKKPVNLQAISQLTYADAFPPVCGAKTDRTQIPADTTIFDTVKNTEIRKLYRDYLFQQRGKPEFTEESPKPPDPRTQNGTILVSVRHDKNHNDLWLQGRNLSNNYGKFIVALFQGFSLDSTSQTQQVYALFKEATKEKLFETANAVKIYLPTAVQGVNRIKADSNKTDPQKIDGLSLWLIAGGLFNFALCDRIKISDSAYDWRAVALEPSNISLGEYRKVLDTLRVYNPPGGGHGIARFDAELVLKLCQTLLNNHPAEAENQVEDELEIWESVDRFIGGFSGTHFGSKGQVYGVKDIFTLGLPGWICPQTNDEIVDYQSVLKEHLSVILSLSSEEGNSELLAAYRDFIAGNNLRNFFPFQVGYADFAVKRLADSKSKSPRLFSVTGLNTMTKKTPDFLTITRDASFLRIAKAINQATVYAGKIQTKDGAKELDWQRQYGLAQLLSSQSGSKKDFVCAIADFLAKYEAENLRLLEGYVKQGKRLLRVQPKKEDLDRLMELLDEFDTVLVANLLIAYGYAKWPKAQGDSPDDSVEENTATAECEDFEKQE
ncbi:hypothetical protein [Tychonema sp. LEGE 07203]|uniref:hypothetical protein n=1 Tax=Tychonema sp. LEGE 07203 TaxID=1828671 RepID=UPI00187EC998|nr:hypothetical protein [Tychonema sp. LEGE 07203]MBE9097456.1 hypothetical protein [Tychonema sp. LEGE 07203]